MFINDLITVLDVNELDANQRIKMIEIALQYIMPRLKAVYTEEGKQEDIPIFIDVKEMDEETGETVRTKIYESVWKKL